MDTDFAGGRLVKNVDCAGETVAVSGVEKDDELEGDVTNGEGGSWIVKAGFLDLLPMADATNVLNLEPAPSFCLDDPLAGKPLVSCPRLECDELVRTKPSLDTFDRDHQGLD